MNTLTFRTTLWFAVLVSSTLVVSFVLGGWLLNRQMIAGLELLHKVEGEELAELLGPDADISDAQVRHLIEHDADSDAELFLIQVHDDTGRVRFRSQNLGTAVLPSHGMQLLHWTVDLPQVGLIRVSEMNQGRWHIQIASRLEPNQRVLADYAQVAGLLTLGGALGSIALGWGFGRLILAPIRTIEKTAQRIGGDNLSERIPMPAGQDELASLTRLLNATFDRIESAFGEVRAFTAAASHELKTPLAVMRLNLEKLRPRMENDPEASSTLADLLEDLDRLHQIIEHLLFLAKVESGVLKVKLEAVNLREWLAGWSEDAFALAEDGGARFEVTVTGEGDAQAVPSLLHHLLLNLLTNALKFSPKGGLISLRVERDGDWWRLEISDEGRGLPEDQLERVFNRFVRYEQTDQAEAKPGHGLGLTICRSIVELHGGKIEARNRTDRSGLVMKVTLAAV